MRKIQNIIEYLPNKERYLKRTIFIILLDITHHTPGEIITIKFNLKKYYSILEWIHYSSTFTVINT
jgi:hypothetical protein